MGSLAFSAFSRSPVHLKFFLCLLFAVSGCRFWLPFLLPLLVASSGCRFASLNPCMIRYYRLIASVQRSLENSAFFCSLFLAKRCSLTKNRPRTGALTEDRARTGSMNRQPETLAPDLNAVRVHSRKIVPGLEALASRYDAMPGPEQSEGPALNMLTQR